MEEVKRQFGQHIALEPEWEAGFYLQIQLRHILAMFQDWCSSDVSLFDFSATVSLSHHLNSFTSEALDSLKKKKCCG